MQTACYLWVFILSVWAFVGSVSIGGIRRFMPAQTAWLSETKRERERALNKIPHPRQQLSIIVCDPEILPMS